MAEYELTLDYSRCTGCRLCEIVCSLSHTLEINPQKSRIQIIKLQDEADVLSIPVKCVQCEKPPCEAICPTKAIYTNPATGARLVNKQKCIGCSACVNVCPFGAISVDRSVGFAFVCDLCDGDPLCVRFCPFDALKYIRSDELTTWQKRVRSNKLIELLKS